MSKKSHNKKRNVGIIYEQLIQYISDRLVNNQTTSANKAKRIVKKHFVKDSQLYKEYRLFMALSDTHSVDPSLATQIISEARRGSRIHDKERLKKEKSILIRDINYHLGQDFYKRKIKEYKKFATIQVLLNEWRCGNICVEYEKKLHEMLTEKKSITSLEEEKNKDVNRLVLKLAEEKFNKKYSSLLNEQQKAILNEYVFSQSSKDYTKIKSSIKKIKEKTVDALTKYSIDCKNETVSKKIQPVITEVRNLSEKNINDETIKKVLSIVQLRNELLENNNE